MQLQLLPGEVSVEAQAFGVESGGGGEEGEDDGLGGVSLASDGDERAEQGELPDGKIDAGDAWLLQARTTNVLSIDTSTTTVPSGPQVDVEVMLAAAAHRLLIGDDGVDVTYEHTDHLGTVNVETDETGTVTQRAQAYPYGTPRHQEGTGWSRHGYTGMERDAGTGPVGGFARPEGLLG